MKLCFIVNQLYKSGGIERTISNRLIELSRSYDIFVITINNGDKPYFYGKNEGVNYLDLNCNFERQSNGAFKKNTYNMNLSLKFYIRLQSVILKIKPDFTINVVGTHSFFILPFIMKKGRTVLEHHSSLYKLDINPLKKYFFNYYDNHIFLNNEERNLAKFIINNKIVIPNPAQTINIKKIPYLKKKNRIIAAGRVLDIKGFDRLIHAWQIVRTEFPEWALEIYGEPDLRTIKKLNLIIEKYGMKESTSVYPATSNILELINDSKIYAMTSHSESFSIVILEAISLGSLVIAFDCPTGPRNIINKQTGYLVENGNIELYAKTLKKAILNVEESESLAINGYYKSQDFSIEKVIGKWKSLFSKLE